MQPVEIDALWDKYEQEPKYSRLGHIKGNDQLAFAIDIGSSYTRAGYCINEPPHLTPTCT
jgi:actin-related protein